MGKGRASSYREVVDRMLALSGGRQCDLAEALGVSPQSVSKKVRGESALLLSDLEKLSAHYDVPMDYFFGGREELPPELKKVFARAIDDSAPLRNLILRLGGLPDDALEHVASLVEAIRLCVPGRDRQDREQHDRS
jgi:transcriptional regulator with XRE-family HTH domain